MRRKAPADQLIAQYLATLDRALGALPRARRRQIVGEISRHIAESRSDLDHESPAAIKALLERVGEPRTIAAEAGAYESETPPSRWTDRLAPWLLLLGGFIFGIGWIVGVVLLWASSTWRRRDKLLGTFVLPGGLALAYTLLSLPASGRACSGSSPPGQRIVVHCTTSGFVLPFPIGILMLVVVVVAPILTLVHLERVRRRGEADRWVSTNL
ncbi:MAG: hypothetical protein M0032_01140 [Actinomycetota bacterium]|nr:hypothetical protein [Actinomycetota bacterium]MDA8292957.1 hypothetical protein [Actinomycetota bacterium]MDA8356264.1 hypothetical protein [Actinomycetota bacterium]